MFFDDYFPNWKIYRDDLDDVVKTVTDAKFVLVIGNGGSETIASHVAIDFALAGLQCSSLSTPSVITALANDFGYGHVYSKQIESYRDPGCLIAVSSSGNSDNIVNAVNTAEKKGFSVVTFSGFQPDNRIAQAGDINIHIPSDDYGVVEVGHMVLLHYVINQLRGFE